MSSTTTHRINQSDFKGSDFARNIHCARPDSTIPYDSILQSAYWAHIAKSVTRLDRIEVIDKDVTYFAELLVIDATANALRVVELRREKLAEKPSSDTVTPPTVEIRNRGPKRWSVIRKPDNNILTEDLPTRADAERYVREHGLATAA